MGQNSDVVLMNGQVVPLAPKSMYVLTLKICVFMLLELNFRTLSIINGGGVGVGVGGGGGNSSS